MTSKEKYLEKKVFSLEQRLVLVERFVELRFSETFRDFTIRNAGTGGRDTGREPPPYHDGEDRSYDADKFKKVLKPASGTRQNSNKGSAKPGPLSSKTRSSAAKQTPLIRDCVVRVTRSSDVDGKQPIDSGTPSKSVGSHRYGTRRQTKGVSEAEPKVKYEVFENTDNDDVDDTTSSFLEVEYERNVDTGDETGGDIEHELTEGNTDDYFTFPADENDYSHEPDDDDPLGLAGGNQSDGNWSGGDDDGVGEDDPDDVDFKVKENSNQKRRATKRKSTGSTGRPRGSKKSNVEPKKRHHIYYLSSMSDLSKDSKVLSSDPSRVECPVCKQFWKVEFIQNHMASHAKERHLKCPHCDKKYFKADDVRNHIKMVHNRAKHYPKCRICKEPIVRKMILHERYCVKKAIQNEKDVDERLVEDIRQQCAQAGLEFVLPDETVPPGLDPAERIKCPQCKKHFQRRLYDRHVKSHSLARNWKCSKCPKAYIHKHDLVRHMCITHEVSLKCQLCGETFETRMQLRNHNIKCRNSKGLVPRPKPSGVKARKGVELTPAPDEISLISRQEGDDDEEEVVEVDEGEKDDDVNVSSQNEESLKESEEIITAIENDGEDITEQNG